jgi:hypothetical protein
MDAAADTRHGTGQGHGEHEASVEPSEGVREVSTHLHRQRFKLPATCRDDDDHEVSVS